MPIIGPLQLSSGFEIAVHEVPRRHRQEVQASLPGIDLTDLLIVTTSQRSDLDLVRLGEDVEKEKDRLLEKFIQFASRICELLKEAGQWADYLDPCSGLLMDTHLNGSVYSEVDAYSTLLGYKTANAGCCKVLLHPKWGTHIYPASLFAKAPPAKLEETITEVDRLISKVGQ